MDPFQILGIGCALISIWLGLTGQQLKGLGGAGITGLSLLAAATVSAALYDHHTVTETLGAALRSFAVAFVIFGFWYGLGLIVRWGWRKATDAD